MNVILELRNRHFFMLDILALVFIPPLALTLRLDRLNWGPSFGHTLVVFTIVALLAKLPIFYSLGLYRCYWRYATVNDLTRVLIAVGLSTMTLMVLLLVAQTGLAQSDLTSPRTLPWLDGLLTLLAVGGFRGGVRGLHLWHRQHINTPGGRRVLVVGAGEAGTLVVREMRANPQLNMEPVVFADDDPVKVGTRIHGLLVEGTTDNIPKLVAQYQIQQIIISIPSASPRRLQELTAGCQQTGIATHCLPGIHEILAGHKTVSPVPQVDINCLLHREPVVVDQTEVAGTLSRATVLVTGAGGSIGSELCRQIARFKPARIILLGHGENSIFEIGLDLRLSFPDLVTHSVIVDVRDRQRVDQIVKTYRPQVIFHAAAHKHVPFMEANIEESITNNVLGTRNVLQAAEQYGVERFILISSDKAVNPTSTMGATKRMAELLVVAAARRSQRAYLAVRFGNVLGSRGSVVPIFQRQIAAGGPVTVTHPDMRRYFMTIPEAVQLVLQATVLGQGGEVFVLDMGQPVRILDLATDLIHLSGLEPGRDIEIVYSGIRPGEKLNEELFLTGEDYQRTKHPKIFMATPESILETEALEQLVLELVKLAQRMRGQMTTAQMRDLLPQICHYIDQYQPQLRLALPKPTPRARTITPDPFYPRSLSIRA